MAKKKKIAAVFQIIDLKMESFNVTTEKDSYNKDSNIVFLLTPETGINREEKLFLVNTKFNLSNEDKNITLCETECKIVFHLTNMDDLVEYVAGKPDIDDNISRYFIGIAISTLRGILFSKFEGTPLEGFILPAIMLQKFKKL